MKKKRSVVSYISEWAGMKKYLYACSILLACLSVIFKLVPYFYISDILNHLITNQLTKLSVIKDVCFIVLFFLSGELCHTISTSVSHAATFEVIKNIRRQLADKIVKMPLGDVLEKGTGSLKSTMMERTDSMESTLAHILPECTSNLLAPVLFFIYLLTIDVRMAFIALIPIGIGILFAIGLFSGYEESYQKTIDTGKVLNNTAVEYVSGIEVIKAFSKTHTSFQRFEKAAEDNAQSYVEWMKRSSFFQAATMTVIPYTTLTVLPFGAWFVYNSSLTLSDFILCLIVSLGLLTPLITLGSYTDDWAACGTIIHEITDILEADEIHHPDVSLKKSTDNSLSFKNVSFAYKDEEVLHNINLQFEAGSTNALVGPSGSGKSTIAKLAAGYYSIQKGEIDLGNVNVNDLSEEDLRRKIAYVSQDNYLFNDTIRENIRQGRPEATDQEVEEIAKKSGCYDFIMSLENGFDTIAGSSGSHLSGGERQRISIARAMLKDAPIIILDEATAYTDPENEAVIDQSLARLTKGKTLIMIAHRLYTIEKADHIFVIDNGICNAEGTHEQLLKNCDLYKRMWESQMSSRDEEVL